MCVHVRVYVAVDKLLAELESRFVMHIFFKLNCTLSGMLVSTSDGRRVV